MYCIGYIYMFCQKAYKSMDSVSFSFHCMCVPEHVKENQDREDHNWIKQPDSCRMKLFHFRQIKTHTHIHTYVSIRSWARLRWLGHMFTPCSNCQHLTSNILNTEDMDKVENPHTPTQTHTQRLAVFFQKQIRNTKLQLHPKKHTYYI